MSKGISWTRDAGRSVLSAALILPLILAMGLILMPWAAGAEAAEPEKVVISGSHYAASGLKIQLTAKVSPAEADQEVVWTSSRPKIAKVSKKGRVTGISEGKAVITAASARNPEIRKTWKITVTKKAAEKVKISSETNTLDLAGEKTVQLTAKALPVKSAAQAFTWESSNPGIASVSVDGKVTAKAEGRAVIIAAAVDGSGVKASIKITVNDTTPPKYYALLIANSKYEYFSVLNGPPKDIQAWKKLLSGLNQPWKITEKHDLTAKQIISSISSAFKGATERDICMLIYAGHGEDDTEINPGALLGVKYDPMDDEGDFVSADRLTYALKKACPGKVFVILESCGSGAYIYDGGELSWEVNGTPEAFTRGVISAFRGADEELMSNSGEMRSKKFTVLAACEYGDSSIQLPLTKKLEAGIFDYCLITAMGCKYPSGSYTGSTPADKNGDGNITLSEIFQGANAVYDDLKTRYKDLLQVFQQYGNPDQVIFTR